MTYKTIKWLLRFHVKNNIRSLWTWKDNEFKCIYKNYTDDNTIYTPQQLLNKLDEVNK